MRFWRAPLTRSEVRLIPVALGVLTAVWVVGMIVLLVAAWFDL